MVEKFVLGTANFGMEYGISCGRKLKKEEVFEILDRALYEGIWGVDTAVAYGEAHSVLGEYIRQRRRSLRIITKLPAGDYTTYEDVYSKVLQSLEILGLEKVNILMLHSFQTFLKHKDIVIGSLKSLRKEGIIEDYGISVYHTQEVFEFYKACKEPFAIEFPLNVFDRRFVPYLQSWKSEGLMLFARSIFLQGLFFLPEDKLKGVFERAKDKILSLRELPKRLGMDLACLCLNFVTSFKELDGFVVGVDNVEQLVRNVDCLRMSVSLDNQLKEFETEDEEIILPYMWRF
ncbi:MAG: aldo/keto reductase [Aquificaceae bacterium]|nr:aldo/keto reductase [Aquificaceae bacterium]MDW8097342.1 aldo/keto reductase [Aquificaceae bacterium]